MMQPILKVRDIAWVRLRSPDLDQAEQFLTDFGLVRAERSADKLFMRGTDAERAFWRRTLEEREQGADDLAVAQQLIEQHAALRDTVERARHYGDAALAALAGFPDGPERRALAGIVEFCIARAR